MTDSEREEAIAALEAGRMELEALCGRLSAEELTRSATIGGTEWSAKDLLGHIAFWEELAAETLDAWRAGRRPPTEGGIDGDWPGTDAANARNQERTAGQSLAQVRERADAAHARIVQALRTLSDTEWHAPPFYPEARAPTLGILLGRVLSGPAGPFRHVSAHLDDLRAYVDSCASTGRE